MFVENKKNYYDGDKTNANEIETSMHNWPKKTLLIAGDSIMNNIGEKRLSRNVNVKGRWCSGAKWRI